VRDRPDHLRLVSSINQEVKGFGLDTEKVADASLEFEKLAGEKLAREDDEITALVLAAYGRIRSAEGLTTFHSAVKVCRLYTEGRL
jgi:hypothetical protein